MGAHELEIIRAARAFVGPHHGFKVLKRAGHVDFQRLHLAVGEQVEAQVDIESVDGWRVQVRDLSADRHDFHVAVPVHAHEVQQARGEFVGADAAGGGDRGIVDK